MGLRSPKTMECLTVCDPIEPIFHHLLKSHKSGVSQPFHDLCFDVVQITVVLFSMRKEGCPLFHLWLSLGEILFDMFFCCL